MKAWIAGVWGGAGIMAKKAYQAIKEKIFGRAPQPLVVPEERKEARVNGEKIMFKASILPNHMPEGMTEFQLLDTINHKIDSGQKLVSDLQAGHVPDRDCTLEDMTNIMWYLQAKGESMKGAFESGAFSIADPNHNIRSFLDSCPEAYQRKSSHISQFQAQEGGRHRGIDCYGDASKTNELLPYGKQTLLYGALNKGGSMPEDRLWLKMESHGCMLCPPSGGGDADGPRRAMNEHDYHALVGHAKSFAETRGEGSKEGSFKERIHKNVENPFKALLKSFNSNPEIRGILNQDKPLDKSQGVRVIYSNAKQALEAATNPADKERIQDFIKGIEDKYDNLHVRIGNEVIL